MGTFFANPCLTNSYQIPRMSIANEKTLNLVGSLKQIFAGALFSIALMVLSNSAFADDSIVLRPTSLGALRLAGKSPTVSEAKLKQLFPQYSVHYEIGSGDSPDFHYFEVATRDGEVLFSIKSFIETDAARKTTNEVPISLLQIWSKKIPDSFGLRVGDKVQSIITKRGKHLKFGAGHHDALIGNGSIYYSLNTECECSPEGLSKTDAIKGNWQIRSISWPVAAWE